MKNLDTIVETMTNQHRLLQKDLRGALELSKQGRKVSSEIEKGLKQFVIDLQEHLHLENEVFYPTLLENMKKNGADTTSTQEFINEMKAIGVVVGAFLEKYAESGAIESQFENFKTELGNIANALTLRIEAEELGVYCYWDIYK